MTKFALLFPAMMMTLASCVSNEEFADRMDRRNDAYDSYNERRTKRLEARQERTDAWFERHMGDVNEGIHD